MLENIITEQACEQLRTLVSRADTIICVCHRSPDGDAIGAVLGWAECLRMMGKEAQIIIPDTIPGKGFFVGQLNLAKRIMDFFVDKRDASNAAKLDSNYIGYYPEKCFVSIVNSSWEYIGTSCRWWLVHIA